MTVDVKGQDRYGEYCRTRLVEVAHERVVAEQPADPEVDNHVKVRHASALYAAAYETARQLVLAALGDRADSVEVGLVDSEIAYSQVGLGVVTSTAERQGEGWESLAEALDAGRPAEVETSVVSTNEDGKAVVTLGARWSVAPAG